MKLTPRQSRALQLWEQHGVKSAGFLNVSQFMAGWLCEIGYLRAFRASPLDRPSYGITDLGRATLAAQEPK